MMRVAPLPPAVAAVLDPDSRAAVDSLCRAAAEIDAPLYLVGGLVRDRLLLPADSAAAPLDIDLAVEGDAVAVAAALGARVVGHERFGTASIRGEVRVDLARTRRDRYRAPAALPEVADAGIDEDLARRDFALNAAAYGLVGPRAGELLDPFDAARDARRRVIRVLHDASFRDDPTRIIRACRYAARLGAHLDDRSRRLARRDRSHLSALSPARFGDAWRLLVAEPSAVQALEMARRLAVPQSRLPGWKIASAPLKAVGDADAEDRIGSFWAAMGLTLPAAVSSQFESNIALNGDERRALDHGTRLRALRRQLAQWKRASAAAAAVEPISDAALTVAACIWSGPAADRLADIRQRRPAIASPLDGDDLAELGIPRGPEIGAWLARLEAACWDDHLPQGRAAARACAEQWVRSAARTARGRGTS